MQLFKALPRGSHTRLASNSLLTARASVPTRGYFSFMEKMKDKFWKPWRHVQSFVEPDGINYQS